MSHTEVRTLKFAHFDVNVLLSQSNTGTKTGITQYSQRRYVHYFKDVIERRMVVRDRPLFLKDVVISMVPVTHPPRPCLLQAF
jgi:hypothetical protein